MKMKAALITWAVVLLGCTATAQPLSTSLPNWLIDSMTFEVFKGRQCSLVVEAQQAEIKSLGEELLTTGTALTLSTNQILTLEGLVKNYETGESLLKREHEVREGRLKKKVRKWCKVAIAEGGIIIILILLI